MLSRDEIFEVLRHTDHTCLRVDTTEKDIDLLIEEAKKFSTASICIPPRFVKYAAIKCPSINICTVIGFPLGYSTTASKLFEANNAIIEGAKEVDMVINIGDLKQKKYEEILKEVQMIKKGIGNNILKVIVETCLLTPEEIAQVTKTVSDASADYIKTSTGFSKEGAKDSDILIFKQNRIPSLKIKAAGGIRSLERAKELIDMGCDRIGASSLVKEAISMGV